MKKLLLLLFAFFALTVSARATDIDVGASSITGFNSANAGNDAALTGVSVTLGSPAVTCSSCLPAGAVGLSGMKVSLGTPAVTYDIASVTSRSAFTLTSNYLATTGTVTGTLYKFVHLRIYALQSFIPSGSSVVVQAGAPGTSAWYRRYGVSVVSDGAQNIAYIPAIDNLPATTNSSVPNVRYYAALYTQGGAFMQGYPGCVDNFRLDSTTTPTSWAQICTFNTPITTPPVPPIDYVTTAQLDARFPSCTAGQMIYYLSTGNVQTCLTPSASQFTITGGVLTVNNILNRIQEEGSNLPLEPTLNFVGSSATAADDPGNTRINVTFDSDLNALASNSTNGFWAAGTNVARTLTGTANEISITNGNGTVGAPVWSLPTALTFTGKTITGGAFSSPSISSPTITTPTITGGTHTGITGLGLRSTGSGAFDLTLANTENLTAGRTLTLTVNDAARTMSLSGNLTTASSFTTSGANALTLTTTAPTNVTLPTTGTLATLAGAETFTNKTLTSPRIGTSVLDTNGNELFLYTATPSAVNEVTYANGAAGNAPSFTASGNDTNINLNLRAKGTGKVSIPGYAYAVNVDTAATGNVGAGLDNLHSYSLPAGSLAANGDYVKVRYGGTFATNDNDKRIEISFGGQVVHGTGLFDQDSGQWDYDITYVRVSSTSVRASGKLIWTSGARDGAGTVTGNYVFGSIHLTLTVADLASNAMTLLVQAEGTSNNDIVQDFSVVELVQR